MHLFIRCLLWILMAALPLQGSAAIFAACKTQAAASTQDCHQHDVSPGGNVQHAGDDTAEPHGKCSTCASCCTAATAPPLAAVLPAPFPRAGRALPPPEPAYAAIFPAGLERPPRAVSSV